jgi:two-component system, chemotaxis family, protein-glutamate methylesterase/glutaminase
MTKPKKIRIVIIDDSAFIRRALTRIFSSVPDFEVVGEAEDGRAGLAQVRKMKPDLVTLDVRMPGIDGLATLAEIMEKHPVPVLMLSSYTQEGGDITLRALELGAVDFIDKSAASSMMDFIALRSLLLERARAVSRVDLAKLTRSRNRDLLKQAVKTGTRTSSKSKPGQTKLLVIGASTGGPPALQQLATVLPPDLPATVLMVQHMPVGFTQSLAERLDRVSRWQVSELENRQKMLPGQMYVAPSGWHVSVTDEDGVFIGNLDTEPLDSLHRPSIDIAMTSAARAAGTRCYALILTGMGRDGSEGARAVRRAGGMVIAESEESSIIFGMPKAVIEMNVQNEILPLAKMGPKLVSWIRDDA